MHKVTQLQPIKTYSSEEEALENLESGHLNQNTFCPLIKDLCKIECICYEPPIIEMTKNNGVVRYTIENGFCSNAMFVGGPEYD